MKLSLCIIAAICVLFANCHSTSFRSKLAQVEVVIEQYPDSAWLLLKSVSPHENLSEEDHALYCLLLTQAQDKIKIKHTSDSLINMARKYYEQTENASRLITSYYYLGRVYQDLGNDISTQAYYLKALEIGKYSSNYLLSKRFFRNLGIIQIVLSFSILLLLLITYKKNMQQQSQYIEDTQIKDIEPQNLMNEFIQTPLYILFQTKEIKITPYNWDELTIWIDRLFANFTHQLRILCPSISTTELQICYLIKIKTPIGRIAQILNLSVTAISHSRKRLYTKLTGMDGSSKDLDSLLSDL